jgi:hypothetical protein
MADLGKAFLSSFALKLPFNPKLTFLFYLSSHLAFGSHFDFSALTHLGPSNGCTLGILLMH